MKAVKTNAMRFLDLKKCSYQVHTYEHHHNDAVDGIHVAKLLNEPVECVFKTLVTISNTKEYMIFMIPVDKELDLKKCAKAAKVKSLDMLPLKDLTKITGYIRGGCSPLAMKKQFKTWIHKSSLTCEHIFFSAGKIGVQIEMNPNDLIEAASIQPADLIMEK